MKDYCAPIGQEDCVDPPRKSNNRLMDWREGRLQLQRDATLNFQFPPRARQGEFNHTYFTLDFQWHHSRRNKIPVRAVQKNTNEQLGQVPVVWRFSLSPDIFVRARECLRTVCMCGVRECLRACVCGWVGGCVRVVVCVVFVVVVQQITVPILSRFGL